MPAPILWYNLSVDEVLKRVQSTSIGLRQSEIDERQKDYGYNELPEKARITPVRLFWRQWNNVFIYILCGAIIIAAGLREWIDVGVIAAAVLLNVLLGFVQEYRAEKSLAALKAFVTYDAKVYRDGLLRILDARELVPGDVVLLEAGDQVPADIRLMTVTNVAAAEAVLTGESDAVNKTSDPLINHTAAHLVADQMNMVFKGTVIAEGKGTGVVVATGMETEIGKIADVLHKTEKNETPLQEKVAALSRWLGVLMVGLAVLIIGIGLVRQLPFWEIFFIAVATAVAAVPEGMVVAITVILAIGMQRILEHRALVRRMAAAETLGSTTVVCVDKTGTITEGVMRAHAIATLQDQLTFDHEVTDPGLFTALIETTLLVNNAVAEYHDDAVKRVIGSPTEKAILEATLSMNGRFSLEKFHRVREVPFTSRTKIMFTLQQSGNAFRWSCKGAPEIVLAHCDQFDNRGEQVPLTAETRQQWAKRIASFTDAGYRVLATATRQASGADDQSNRERTFTLLGLWILRDPIRPHVDAVIRQAAEAGVRTIMITGDHASTAKKIASDIGLVVDDASIMTGEDLLETTPDALADHVMHVSVFARVSPADKLKIVGALQRHGEVVAMTGDGVNDAPALKRADIGIAVGSGTDVTKETADMILLDNNFRTIIDAIAQGRLIFANVKKVMVYLLASSFSEIIIIMGSLLFALPLPITARMILWINVITDALPAMALTLEKRENGIMQDQPTPRAAGLLDKRMKVLIFGVGLLSNVLLFGAYYWLLGQQHELIAVRSLMFVAIGMNALLFAVSCRSLREPVWRTGFRGNPALVVAIVGGLLVQIMPLYIPVLSRMMQVVPLNATGWMVVGAIAIIQLIAIEITKYIFNRRKIV